MKISAVVISFFLLLSILSVSQALTGIGIILGDPTGISLKFDNFPVIGLGWSFGNNKGIHLTCDYWIKNTTLADPFKWYIGVGGKLKIGESSEKHGSSLGLGIRVPIGLQVFAADNIEIFGEIAPGMTLIEKTGIDIGGGIGVRFYL